MTNIEMDMARSTIRKNSAVCKHLDEVNWEQRRYEIAKDLYVRNYGHTKELSVTLAIALADAFINELKKGENE